MLQRYKLVLCCIEFVKNLLKILVWWGLQRKFRSWSGESSIFRWYIFLRYILFHWNSFDFAFIFIWGFLIWIQLLVFDWFRVAFGEKWGNLLWSNKDINLIECGDFAVSSFIIDLLFFHKIRQRERGSYRGGGQESKHARNGWSFVW